MLCAFNVKALTKLVFLSRVTGTFNLSITELSAFPLKEWHTHDENRKKMLTGVTYLLNGTTESIEEAECVCKCVWRPIKMSQSAEWESESSGRNGSKKSAAGAVKTGLFVALQRNLCCSVFRGGSAHSARGLFFILHMHGVNCWTHIVTLLKTQLNLTSGVTSPTVSQIMQNDTNSALSF